MSTTYTPGPWTINSRAGYLGHGIRDRNGRSVCAIPSNGSRPLVERDANARLLAAAPEMLAALRAVAAGYAGAYEQAVRAIQAAVGETTVETKADEWVPVDDPDAWKRADDALIAAKRRRTA